MATRDKDYSLVWFTEQSMSNVVRLDEYVKEAERTGDTEVADLFRKAQEHSRKGGIEGKRLLRARLGQ